MVERNRIIATTAPLQTSTHLTLHEALCLFALAGGLAAVGAADFERPVRLKGGDSFVRVESPGWAAPCLADLDGDGKKDLLVGQFNQGKIQVFKGLGGNQFAAGNWLKADGAVAEIPGVW